MMHTNLFMTFLFYRRGLGRLNGNKCTWTKTHVGVIEFLVKSQLKRDCIIWPKEDLRGLSSRNGKAITLCAGRASTFCRLVTLMMRLVGSACFLISVSSLILFKVVETIKNNNIVEVSRAVEYASLCSRWNYSSVSFSQVFCRRRTKITMFSLFRKDFCAIVSNLTICQGYKGTDK